jgi:hypothetical protein
MLIVDLAALYYQDPLNPSSRPLTLNDQSLVFGGLHDAHDLHKAGFDVDISRNDPVYPPAVTKEYLNFLAWTVDPNVLECHPGSDRIHYRLAGRPGATCRRVM